MRGRYARRALGLLLLFSLLAPLAGPGVVMDISAVTQAEIDALKGDASALAEQKKDLQNQLKAVQADKSEAMARKELLERQIDVIQKELDNIQRQIIMYDQLIAEKAEELAQAQAEEEAQFALFCRRMRSMEEQGETSYWSVLFSSASFSELLDNYMMIEEIIAYDNQIIDELTALQDRVAGDKAELEAAQAAQEEAKQQQEAARAELKAQEAEVDKLIDQIKDQEDELKAMEAELARAAAALDAKIKAAEREYADQIAAVHSESGFRWPLDGGRNILFSLFGPREDPISHQPGNHTGIDIPAPRNTPIYAAKSGVVTTSVLGSGVNWSYGNFVVVSHSDGTSTPYAHMNSRNVAKGQTVRQGDVVGYVGTTGRSSGNHLHFEIRVNGERKDPMDFYRDKALYFQDSGVTVPLWDWMK